MYTLHTEMSRSSHGLNWKTINLKFIPTEILMDDDPIMRYLETKKFEGFKTDRMNTLHNFYVRI